MTLPRLLATVWLLLAVGTLAAQGPDLSRHPQFGPPSDGLKEPPPFDPSRMSGPTPPNLLNPPESKVWTCGKCGAVIGTGPREPQIETCPHCGAKLASWFNYWIVGGLGGAVFAVLTIVGVLVRPRTK